MNSEQQEFGEACLQSLVQSSIGLTASEICVAEGLQAFVGQTLQWDGIVLVVLKISKKD